MESINFLVESIAIQMKTLIYAVELFNSLVECLFVFFFFALPLTEDVALVAECVVFYYLPLNG